MFRSCTSLPFPSFGRVCMLAHLHAMRTCSMRNKSTEEVTPRRNHPTMPSTQGYSTYPASASSATYTPQRHTGTPPEGTTSALHTNSSTQLPFTSYFYTSFCFHSLQHTPFSLSTPHVACSPHLHSFVPSSHDRSLPFWPVLASLACVPFALIVEENHSATVRCSQQRLLLQFRL